MKEFGKAIRGEWLLDEDVIFLNHGSFGACPRPVLAVQREWQERMEAEPVRFMTRELPEHLEASRAELATFVGSRAEDLVFVQNATDGANAVLRSLLPTFKPGDELLTSSHAYRAVRQTMVYVAALSGATVVDADVPFPIKDQDEVVEAIARSITPKTAFAVIDHITSPTGLIFPIAQVIEVFKERGIPVLIDGAHAPGQVELNLDTLGADYYVGNCHKWLYAPKGAALLWVDRKHQSKIHPTVISHFLGGGYQTEFAWTGTLDPTAFLSVPAGIEFHKKLAAHGSREYTQRMLLDARSDISAALGVSLAAPPDMLANLCTIPLPGNPDATEERALHLHDVLFDEYRIEIPAMNANGKLCVRASSQVYNHPSDFNALKQALVDLSGAAPVIGKAISQ
ncbi:MAG: aminotransferase class V-fold PLP-dependent enzyme [Bacteroidota bacterium]|nr:aminotransferase class V-fold PLP-dependent enzyme [Bacteroidota bacterium]MDP4233580.1 aminotransferase class V-fold PLP-dependent enzyme [Bacteroidota bacterium]MDP4243646.1 aminotransferase class V-fold PLP-dependent enzyme [Bacteroidota bacterium]MDP4287767.1 aminotransferase class V-fold PLP-dependent enzyme [Bacteroidota bacterium]